MSTWISSSWVAKVYVHNEITIAAWENSHLPMQKTGLHYNSMDTKHAKNKAGAGTVVLKFLLWALIISVSMTRAAFCSPQWALALS